MTKPKQCPTCGQPHAPNRCTAHRRSDGAQCGNDPMQGQRVCRMHGGSTKKSRAKGARVVAEVQAVKAVATLGLAVDVSPTEALLEEVRWTAGHVGWLRARVQELDEQTRDTGTNATGRHPLVWGVTEESEKTGGDDWGSKTVEKAAPSIWYQLYDNERKHLVAVCSAALKAGVEERRVQLAEQQGVLLAQVIRAILHDLGLTAKQQTLVGTVVPKHLRAIGAL